MDDIDVDEEEPTPAQKFHFVYLVPYLFALFANLAYVVKVFFTGVSQITEAHCNYVGNKDLFAAEAGAEIEKLVKGEVDG